MTDYKSKTICCVDNGLFVEFAMLLARDFGKVLYYAPWVSSFPKSNALLIGHGLPGVERVKEFWPMIDDIDLFVFPDVYFGDMQVHLENIGKRVWGSRKAEQFELDRVESKEICKELGIDIGPYKVVTGLDALREYLKKNEDQFVKICATRGDMETFKAKNYKLIEPRLDELEHSLGAKKKVMNFVVEEAIDPAIEVGYDGYCIDGKFPDGAMFGIEIKDKGYLCMTGTIADVPKQVVSVNKKLAPAFAACNYRGFWSSEVRITPDNTPYLIDPCPRLGSPPGELYQIMITNWPDIIWEGAGGTLVEPKFAAKWGAELLLISMWADKNWQAVEFPKKYRDNVRLRNCCQIDGRYYVAPQWTGMPEMGAVVALGDSGKEAIKNCLSIAEQVEGYFIEVHSGSLEDAAGQFQDLIDQTT